MSDGYKPRRAVVARLAALSEDELAAVLREAEKAYIEAIQETERRFLDSVKAAYAHELPYVDDIWAGVVRAFPSGHRIEWCFYCGERPGWQDEHKQPRSRGGGNEPGNIVRSCRTCNLRKGTMTFEEYRATLSARAGARHVFFGERKTR